MPKQSEGNKDDILRRAKELLESENLEGFLTTDVPKLIHDLRVHQIELEMQNEELRRAQMELEESRNKYAELYDFAPVGYFTLNKKTLIQEANLTGAALLGIERNYLINKRFSHYISKENQDAFYFYRKRLVETKSPKGCELKMLKDDGTLFHAELKGVAVFDMSGNLSQYRLAVLDITQRKLGELILQENLAQLSKRRRYESIITSVTRSVHSTIDLKEVMENAVKALNENVEDTDFVSIYMVQGEEAVLMAHKGYPDQYVERAGRIPHGRGTTWKTIIEGKTRYVPDTDQDTVIGPAGRDIGTKSYLSAPIYFEGKAIGALNINSLNRDAFDEEELKLMEIVTKQIEIAINNARQAESLRVSRENYRHLFENVPVGIYRTTPDGRIIMANPALIKILGYSSFDELASHNLEDEEFSAKYPRSKFKQVLEHEGEVRGLESVWIKKDGSSIHVSENAKAIRAEDGAVLYYEGTVEDITERKKADELLKQNLTLLDKKNRYESIISSITRSVHSSINLQEVLDNAVDSMIENIEDVDYVFISLVEGKEAGLKSFRGHPTWFVEQVRRVPYPEVATWNAIIEGKPKYVADVDRETAGREEGAKSYLSMPLQLEDKTVGVININSSKKDAFEEDEIKLLEIVTRQIETAINNAKQAEELGESREKLRLLIEGVKDYAIFMLDAGGYIASWNIGAKKIKGYEAEEIIGKHFSIFFPTDDLERGKPEYKLKVAREEGRVEDEGWRIRKDGTRFWADVVITALRDEAGHLRGFVKVTQDSTERKQAEEMLKKAKEELELRVAKRTKELAELNENLKKEIAWHMWAEDTLRGSEERYRILYEENPSMYLTVNEEGKILSINQFGAERLGFSTHELIGQSMLNFIHEADRKEALDRIKYCYENKGELVQWEFRKIHKNGSVMWVRESERAIKNTDGSIVALIVSEDISDRKHIEDALRRHSQILDLANDMILIRDIHDKIIYWNQGAEWTYGWTKEEAVGKNVHELLQTEFPESLEKIREKLYIEKYWEGEVVHRRRDGTLLVVSSRWTAHSETEGNPSVILEINNDITERIQVERTLRESEERFASFMHHLPGAAWIKDVDGRYVYANEISQKIFNNTLDNLLGKADDEVFDTDTADQFKKNDRIVIESKQSLQTIETLPQDDGVHHSIVTKFPITDQNGTPVLVGAVAIDITERKHAEEKMRLQKELYEAILKAQSDVGECFIIVEDDRIIYANEACDQIGGYCQGDLTALSSFFEIVIPEQRALLRHQLNKLLKNKSIERKYEIGVLKKNGETVDLEIAVHPLQLMGNRTQLIIIGRDITERKRADEQIKTSLQEKEMLLREIHHRVKNNLQIISSLLSLQSRRITDKQIREELIESQNRVKSMALVHEKLYQSGNLAGVDFARYAKSLTNHLFRSYGADSSVKLKIDTDKVLLSIDKAILCGLIVQELVSNSLKHAFSAGNKGKIRISLHADDSPDKPPDSSAYHLTIGDNGVGFPKDLDFRRAKSLGLQLVCALTKQLKGTIELDASSGTEFRIKFTA